MLASINNAVRKVINNAENIHSPAIIYSSEILKENLSMFCDSLKSISNNTLLLYSVKACMHSDVIKEMASEVDGFSVSSEEEYRLVSKYNKRISATGFGYSENFDISKGYFYFNSILQLRKYLENKHNTGIQEIGIRINAPRTLFFKDKKSSRFGFTLDQLKLLECLSSKHKFKVKSILIHQENKVLKDSSNLKSFISMLLKKKELKMVTSINLGGGWDNLFLKGQISEFINNLKIPSKYSIFVEPGSALVRTIGILKTSVIDETIDNNIRRITLNTSQFNNSSWYVPRIIACTKSNGKQVDTYVYGNTCYEKDFFGRYLNFSVSINDDVIMYPVGAYYYTTHRELHGFKFPKEYYI
ncbi:hypothetical protein [uncultured Lactobacillus sp.]|uniref:hypothetical protein n=1 Tax=uncultured Lactobacillus sp. TaxID=153152 RepID=UPI00259B59F5|nr:hypothetical protein [uncultured Lactobacillus sp.]